MFNEEERRYTRVAFARRIAAKRRDDGKIDEKNV